MVAHTMAAHTMAAHTMGAMMADTVAVLLATSTIALAAASRLTAGVRRMG